ncbi:hypothetical protein CSC17_0488 [Klebsiella oxytoca]|nr:hypothetical protein CSC17_0488 [Klebsiella oxytoca]
MTFHRVFLPLFHARRPLRQGLNLAEKISRDVHHVHIES